MAQLEISSLFVSPQQQLENIHRWSWIYGFGLTKKDFRRLGPSPAPGNGFIQPVLVPYLDDLQTKERTIGGIERTFEMLWTITVAQQSDKYRWPGVQSDPEHIRYFKDIQHPGKCLRWEIIDLTANWDKMNCLCPKDVRNPKTSPHAGILAAAVHFPKWVQAMDGETVPYVFLGGYELNTSGGGGWWDAPGLYWDAGDRQVKLLANHCGGHYDGWAVPSLQ